MNIEKTGNRVFSVTYPEIEGRFEVSFVGHMWKIQRKNGNLCEGLPYYAEVYEYAIRLIENICQEELKVNIKNLFNKLNHMDSNWYLIADRCIEKCVSELEVEVFINIFETEDSFRVEFFAGEDDVVSNQTLPKIRGIEHSIVAIWNTFWSTFKHCS